jgi:hypothetical protein
MAINGLRQTGVVRTGQPASAVIQDWARTARRKLVTAAA